MSTGDNNDSKREYKIGYGKPPVEHRFRKGQSGNPNGRRANPDPVPQPAAEERTKRFIATLARRKVSIMENGRPRSVHSYEALLTLLFRNALQNDKRSLLAVIKMLGEIEAEQKDDARSYFRSLVEYKADGERHARHASQPEGVYPDWRDIDLNWGRGTGRITGPMDAEEAKIFDGVAAWRDELIEDCEEAMNDRDRCPSEYADKDIEDSRSVIERLNAMLPKRMRRMPKTAMINEIDEHAGNKLMQLCQDLESKRGNRPRKRR